MTNDDVLAAIDVHRQRLATCLQIRQEDVLAGLLGAIERAKEQGNPSAEIRGWGAVAKLLFFTPERHTIQITDDIQRIQKKFEAMSDSQLLAIAGQN